tara:strand:+ start:3436 stop:5280 length:1845 start_codon:yes stop_codon:yes gene_type:complete
MSYKPVMLYAGLAVMLMRKHRNVLPIKYLYRKSGVNNGGFTFEPVAPAHTDDESYLKSSLYPEIIYNSDRAGQSRPNRLRAGNIPDSWKYQFKGGDKSSGVQTGKKYKRGGNIVPAGGGLTYDDYSYFTPEGVSKGAKFKYGDFTRYEAKTAEDMLKGSNQVQNNKGYEAFKGFQQRPTSNLQITPKGMKARWVRGGGPARLGKHLRTLKLPNNTRLSKGPGTGDVSNLPRNHIMNHWYKLYQHNYERVLQGQSRRVLVDFMNIMGRGSERGTIKTKDSPKVTRKSKTVRDRTGLKKTRYPSSQGLVKRYAKSKGVAGGASTETVMDAMKGGWKMLTPTKGGIWEEISDDKTNQDIVQFLNSVRNLQVNINASEYEKRKIPKRNRLIGVELVGGALGLIVTGRPGNEANPPVLLTASVIMTGRREMMELAASELRALNRRGKAKVQSTLGATAEKKTKTDALMVTEAIASYEIITRAMGVTLSLEGSKGAEINISEDFNDQLKRNMTKGVSASLKDMKSNAALRKQFDPMSEGREGDFRDWYLKWMRESKRLENMTVESARRSGGWNDWMMRYVAPAPSTNNPMKGKLGNYRNAARSWHSPSYIRPFVMTDAPL